MTDKKILVIGDVMLDIYNFGEVNRISPEAPVPIFLESGKMKYVPGGAANVAVNVAAAGISVDICSVIGEDGTAEVLKQKLVEQGVGIRFLCKEKERRTIQKLRFIGPNNQQILRVDTEYIYDVPYNTIKEKEYEISNCIKQYGIFLISDYNKGFLTEEIIQMFIRVARNNSVPVLIDVKDRNFRKYRNATLLKPNRKELSDLTGMRTLSVEDIIAASKYLCQEVSCEYVLTTLGAEGMLLVGKNSIIKKIDSVANEVYDVTGAGDTSIAYLAAELMRGKNVVEAMEISNYAAGLQVSKLGTNVVYPEEINDIMRHTGTGHINKKLDCYQADDMTQLRKRQAQGCKVVFTNGCFDILHAGHVTYLNEAKKLGDILIVGVNTDESVRRLKGAGRPVNTLRDRMLLLSSLECIDYVVPFQEDTPLKIIEKIKPDVLVKGGDYQTSTIVGAREVMESGGEVQILPFVQGKSTTKVIEKCRQLYMI